MLLQIELACQRKIECLSYLTAMNTLLKEIIEGTKNQVLIYILIEEFSHISQIILLNYLNSR